VYYFLACLNVYLLPFILSSDRILVLDQGQIIEFGTPLDLIEKSPIGHFRKMCEDTGEFDELVEIARTKSSKLI
jgi:ABC-type multidrug transport system ATPase subunit